MADAHHLWRTFKRSKSKRQDLMGHIFISYSHRDTDYANQLTEMLRASGFNVWIDTRLNYGAKWPRELQTQLDTCDAFILIMTAQSFESDWVQSELMRAKRKSKPIFPLLLEGDEPWLSVETIQFYDVHGGKLLDNRFFSSLKCAVSTGHKDQTLRWRKYVPMQTNSEADLLGSLAC
jgi:hypothetical protein